MSMSFNSLRPVLLVVTALGLAAGVGGVLVWAQPAAKTATIGKFDAVGANPNYIVVNTPTQVLFTAKITDPQLKKRSVVLLRTDAAGTPKDILGRLHDDGKNGDLRANDNIYSFSQTLRESAVGTANFRIAARFKPGKWTEPESDDDNWDKDLATLSQLTRDRPAVQSLIQTLLRRVMDRYVLSGLINIDIWAALKSSGGAFAVNIPPAFYASESQSKQELQFYLEPPASGRTRPSVFRVYVTAKDPNQTLQDFLISRGANPAGIKQVVLSGRAYLSWTEDLGDGLTMTAYSTAISSSRYITVSTLSVDFAASSVFTDIIKSLSF